jgi:GPH family glycoside/pentoside/hexuronide:cation symporter
MRYSAIPMGLFAVLMIYVPIGHESWINVAWLFVNLLLFNLFSSLFLVPFYGLMAELVTDTKRRVYFFTINTLLFVIGSAVIYVTPIIKNALVSAGYPELTAWRSAFLVFGVLGAASAFVSSFSIKESDYVKRTPSYVPLWESLKATFRYKDFTILVVGYMFMWIAFSFFNSSLMYYVTMLLGLKDNFAVVVMAIAIVVGISTYPLVNSLAKKIGKKPLLIGACISYIVIYTGIFFYQFFVGMVGNAVTGILIGALIGFPISITNIIPLAAFADLAQYDTIKTGRYQSGMFVGSRNLLQQLAQAIALLIVPLTITGSVLEGNANIAGVRMTTLIAAGTIAVAFAFYLFYNDKKITKTIDDYNALHVGDEQV